MNKKDGDNSTFHKRKTRLLRGKTKQVLILIPAVLLITCILAMSMASSQIQANELSTQANSISAKNGGMSLIGNMTVTGNSTINGTLTITDAAQIILGSPLITTGYLSTIGDSIEIGKPYNAGDTITLTGTESNPAIIDQCGNIIIGNQSEAREIIVNATNFYQRVESYGEGYIGDWNQSNHLPVNSKVAINVSQGTLYSLALLEGIPINTVINSTLFHLDVLGYNFDIDLTPYSGIANITRLRDDGHFETPINITGVIGDVIPSVSMYWNDTISLEVWGPWFAVGNTTSGEGGLIYLEDAYFQIKSNDTIYFEFLNTSAEAGLKITPSAHYPKAVMNVTAQEQNIAGSGLTYITNGTAIVDGTASIEQQNQIINGVIDFEGEMLLEGNTTSQGTLEISGDSIIKGPVTVTGSLNINGGMMKGTGSIGVSDGDMQTSGSMKISNGTVEVLNGRMILNSSGTYIGSETSILGDLDVSGTVTNSGLLSMSGTFQIFTPLSITGAMVTIGVTSMGSLGAINGILSIMGNVMMSGMTVISGDNNVIGSMTVTPVGVMINGLVGLTGVVHTTGGLPAMSSSTILEVSSGSMMGVPIPHVSLMANPLALLALGILGIGTVWVAIRGVYIGIKERRTVALKIRRTGERLENIINKVDRLLKRLSEAVNKLPERLRRG